MSVLGAHAVDSYDPDGQGPTDTIAYPNLYQVFGNSTAQTIVSQIQANISSWAQSQAASGNGLNAQALQQIFNLQAGMIVNASVPIGELFFDAGYPEWVALSPPPPFPDRVSDRL
jgi:choline dehydrogenase